MSDLCSGQFQGYVPGRNSGQGVWEPDFRNFVGHPAPNSGLYNISASHSQVLQGSQTFPNYVTLPAFATIGSSNLPVPSHQWQRGYGNHFNTNPFHERPPYLEQSSSAPIQQASEISGTQTRNN